MYALINLIALLLGSISVICLLIRQKVDKKRAACLAALLFMAVLCVGLDPWHKEDGGFGLGFSSIRGMIGASAVLVTIWKWFPKYFDKYLKAIIVSLPLMYSVSKLSCLYVGCCHGFEYNGPFAYIHDGDSYFPVQLAEIICFAIIYTISLGLFLSKKNVYNLPFLSLGAKFLLDFCRAERTGIWIFSKNQIILLLFAIVWIVYLKKNKAPAKKRH